MEKGRSGRKDVVAKRTKSQTQRKGVGKNGQTVQEELQRGRLRYYEYNVWENEKRRGCRSQRNKER